MLVQRAVDYLAAVVFVNTVGGQDELVFDGHSLAIDQDGTVLTRGPQFEEKLGFATIDPREVVASRLRDTRHRANVRRQRRATPVAEPPVFTLASVNVESEGEIVAGEVAPLLDPSGRDLRRAVHRSAGLRGQERLRARAARALRWHRLRPGGAGGGRCARTGACDVRLDALPYSSEGTRADARAIAENLGVDFREISIAETMESYDDMLGEAFAGREPDITEENVQARIRGNVVMALSNKFGWLVLTTGNKSELSVGYATLYGDMAGGFAVLKDVYKGWVYRLVRWRNETAGRELVPATVLDRPPSAELRYEQRDDDSLPPYDLLDRILEGYIEEDLDAVELARRGLPADDVERVIRMVDRAEYKRRQAPPGIKISTKAFGRDRRLPITNRYVSRVRRGVEAPR